MILWGRRWGRRGCDFIYGSGIVYYDIVECLCLGYGVWSMGIGSL